MHHFLMVDWLSVFFAALASFVLGALWYSPLMFAKSWMQECGYSEEYLRENAKPAKAMSIAFITAFIQGTLLAFLFSRISITSVLIITKISLIIGALLVGLSYISDAQFNLKSRKLVLIEAGYRTSSITLMGLVLALL